MQHHIGALAQLPGLRVDQAENEQLARSLHERERLQYLAFCRSPRSAASMV